MEIEHDAFTKQVESYLSDKQETLPDKNEGFYTNLVRSKLKRLMKQELEATFRDMLAEYRMQHFVSATDYFDLKLFIHDSIMKFIFAEEDGKPGFA